MAQLSLSLFGPFQVDLQGEPVTSFATDKTRALLCYLAVESDCAHRREVLAGLLWPDQPEGKARKNLRQTLLFLRQAIEIGDEGDPPTYFLHVTRGTIQFNVDSDYWLDTAAFSDLIAANQKHHHRRLLACQSCRQRLIDAVELYRGSFLERFFLRDSAAFEEWALVKREWFHQQAVRALNQLAGYFERRGDYVRAHQYAWRQVEMEPWREEAHRQLMRLLALSGQRSAALAQFETCRHMLDKELGVEPTIETISLYEQIRAGGELPWEEPLHNLPPAPTSFIGREKDVVKLADMLANPDCRLVTLIGPGGIGKTRLALRAAADQVGAFLDGVFFVSLEAVSSAEFMAATIADALEFPFSGHQDHQEQLVSFLQDKELLLLLDNLEHILPGRELLADLLKRSPGVVLLATSRERLNLQEEWIYQVEGLIYPQDRIGDSLAAQDALESYSAVRLFLQRAQQVDRSLALSGAELEQVAHICRLLEGMPLGIELAAAWLESYSSHEIAQEIERNLDILTTSLHNVPERHRSMWATFEHSWGLLSEQEREVFAALSRFVGGFDSAAARQVTGAPVMVLKALLHKSLLRRGATGRYEIHRLLRQYAAQKLAQDPQQQEQTACEHAGYYAVFLQQREEELKGKRQQQALEEIRAEIDNVRRAWNWAVQQIEQGQRGTTAAMALAQSMESLSLFYTMRGWYHEGEAAFSQAVMALDAAGSLGELAAEEKDLVLGRLLARQGRCCEFTEHSDKAVQLYERGLAILQRLGAGPETALPLFGLGYMAHIKGEYARAKTYSEQSLDIHQQVGDLWGVSNALNTLCLVARRQGDFADAKQRCQESLTARREIGDQRGVAASLNNLGLILCSLGQYAEAREMLLEALHLCRQLGHKVGVAHALTGLCQAAFRLGEGGAAEQFCRESKDVYQSIGDYWGVAIAYNNLGRIAAELGNHAKARPLYAEAVAVYQRIGVKSGLANTLCNLGESCYRLGAYDESRQYLIQALRIAHEIGVAPTALKSLVGWVHLLRHAGDWKQGLELLALVLHHPAAVQALKEEAQGLIEELAVDLSPETVAAATARGQASELDEVVARILADEEAIPRT